VVDGFQGEGDENRPPLLLPKPVDHFAEGGLPHAGFDGDDAREHLPRHTHPLVRESGRSFALDGETFAEAHLQGHGQHDNGDAGHGRKPSHSDGHEHGDCQQVEEGGPAKVHALGEHIQAQYVVGDEVDDLAITLARQGVGVHTEELTLQREDVHVGRVCVCVVVVVFVKCIIASFCCDRGVCMYGIHFITQMQEYINHSPNDSLVQSPTNETTRVA
jgi:hypothetical protein